MKESNKKIIIEILEELLVNQNVEELRLNTIHWEILSSPEPNFIDDLIIYNEKDQRFSLSEAGYQFLRDNRNNGLIEYPLHGLFFQDKQQLTNKSV